MISRKTLVVRQLGIPRARAPLSHPIAQSRASSPLAGGRQRRGAHHSPSFSRYVPTCSTSSSSHYTWLSKEQPRGGEGGGSEKRRRRKLVHQRRPPREREKREPVSSLKRLIKLLRSLAWYNCTYTIGRRRARARAHTPSGASEGPCALHERETSI